MMTTYTKPDMPDVAAVATSQQNDPLDWVGMSRIAQPVSLLDSQRGAFTANAFIETYVSLVKPVKGIHMSRLYLLLAELAKQEALSVDRLTQCLQEQLNSHHDISDSACIDIAFDYVINQPALKSEYSGWKDYPVGIRAQWVDHRIALELNVKVPYSSTCPCSAALSRQLLQKAFVNDFANNQTVDVDAVTAWLSENGSIATPHSQRSYANVWVKLGQVEVGFPISQLISDIESTLKTPVQTAVKREDEQEFARLNGANQMFCEDAARRIKQALDVNSEYTDFWVRVEHIESLHAHDAVAMVTKGVANGYTALLHR